MQQCTCNACRLHGAQLPGRGENLEIRVLLYSTLVCEVTVTTPLLSCVDDRLRGSSPVDHREHACIPWPFMRRQDSFLVLPLRGAFEAMAQDRNNSWDSCLCHGSIEAFDARSLASCSRRSPKRRSHQSWSPSTGCLLRFARDTSRAKTAIAAR